MFAERCATCKLCQQINHTFGVTDTNGTETIQFNGYLKRRCGAGNTEDLSASCENGRYKSKMVVIVYPSPFQRVVLNVKGTLLSLIK